jgi:hypothetical protein
VRVAAAFAIVCGVLFVYGFSGGDGRMSLKALDEKRLLTIVVVLHDIDESYRYLSVYGCSAEMGEEGTHCNGFFERESTQELYGAWKQHLVTWRDVPRGTMQITAIAFDVDRKPLSRGQLTVFR